MAEASKIAWTDATFNGWIGCTEVGEGCRSCYARTLDSAKRWGGVTHWGVGVPRYRTSPSNWAKPISWNKKAEAAGRPLKVFCNSLGDVFDAEVDPQWRADLFSLWRATPWLNWIVVTKRVPNIKKMIPDNWAYAFGNVGLVATVVDQDEMNRDGPRLLKIPAAWHGFSLEPQIGPVVIPGSFTAHPGSLWFITGGESRQRGGPEPREYDPVWAAILTQACRDARKAWLPWFAFVKQTGARPRGLQPPRDGAGADPEAWPADLRVRDFPPELCTRAA